VQLSKKSKRKKLMDAFNTALTSAVGTTTDMIAAIGGKGVVITLSVLAAAIVIIFVRIGWRKGLKAMQGRG